MSKKILCKIRKKQIPLATVASVAWMKRSAIREDGAATFPHSASLHAGYISAILTPRHKKARRREPSGFLIRAPAGAPTSCRHSRRGRRRALGALQRAGGVEVGEGLLQALGHAHLGGADPHARVVELLVRLVLAVGVADLALQVALVLEVELADAVPVGPLGVGVDVHLDDAVADGLADFLLGGAGAAVEHEVQGVGRHAVLVGDVGLRIAQDGRGQLDVARLVDAVDVAEGGGDGEVRADLAQFLVGVGDVGRLGVQRGVVHAAVVHAVLFAAGHAELDLQRHAELGHAGEVLAANRDVFLQRLLGQVEHVRAEQRRAGGGEVPFALVQQQVDPRQQLLRRVVGVDDGRDAVLLGQQMDVAGAGDRAERVGLLAVELQALAGDELRAAVGELDDDRRLGLRRRLQHGVDGVGADDVDGGQGEPVRLGDLEQLLQIGAGDHAGLDGI
jgi:hypothetical protein